MLARYIIGLLALVFLALGIRALPSGSVQGRTWLLTGSIFAVVSAWLFLRRG